ncbi:MAG TPA: hypothetical protein VE623_10725 [Acidimicrobiales bacterium]|nr:hypothetical protein [Acidimicrobiales bacterium]
MRSLHRYPDQTALDVRGGQRRPEAHGRPSPLAGSGRGDGRLGPQVVETPPTLERWDLVESRWGLGSVVVLLAGAALAVLGVVAAGRTGIDDTWYQPVAAVAGLRHTALLAGLEVGVGVLLVVAGLAGARGAAALVCITGAMAAGVAAIEPELVADELALQRWWAVALAAAGAGLAVVSMVPWPHFVERHYSRAAGRLHAAAPARTRSPGAAQPVRTPSSAGWS